MFAGSMSAFGRAQKEVISEVLFEEDAADVQRWCVLPPAIPCSCNRTRSCLRESQLVGVGRCRHVARKSAAKWLNIPRDAARESSVIRRRGTGLPPNLAKEMAEEIAEVEQEYDNTVQVSDLVRGIFGPG